MLPFVPNIRASFIFSRIPGKTYMIIAFLTVGTMGLSNTSLGYLNYPTQVIFKCCKLIPVMIGGIFIQGMAYSCYWLLFISKNNLVKPLYWFLLPPLQPPLKKNLEDLILINRKCAWKQNQKQGLKSTCALQTTFIHLAYLVASKNCKLFSATCRLLR